MSVDKAIKRAKQIIDNDGFVGENYKGHQPVYFVTNENINAYFQLADFKNKSLALTVLSSGDHAFSLATKGIMNIDTFDINELQEYIALGLKRAMIEKYSYAEFINIINELVSNYSLDDVSSIIYDLFPLMDIEYRIFWQNVIDYYYKKGNKNKNLIQILCREKTDTVKYVDRVPFLKSEEEYNKLRNIIGRINLTFKSVDAMNLGKEYASKKYDFILLSNILSYLSKLRKMDKLTKYLDSLENITTSDGIIFLKYLYLFNYSNINQSKIRYFNPFYNLSENEIEEMDIILADLRNADKFGEAGMVLKRMP